MTEAFDKLKAMLEEKKALTDEEIAQVESEVGGLEDEERVWLDAERHKLETDTRAGEEITLDQYIAATQTLDSAEPGSPEYEEAERIVEAFESAA